DEDIDPGALLRFSPHAPKKSFHRFQHIYGWFLYSLMTIMWVVNKDYKQMIGYQKRGLIEKQGTTFGKEMTILIVSKIFYFSYVLVLPLLVTDIHWSIIVGGFVWAHLIAGLILAAIFQPAHVLPENTYPLPVDPGVIEDSFMIHQLRTTADFAHRNRLLSWYVGGLNYQVEHHLFPNICHVHYRKLAPIVAETAREFNVPYHSFETFRGALKAHHKMLFQLGRT
ncbi:MAG: fatty acid desaturase, partial [Bacteroidetes bacterium]|nr:fatty acid desaturase [Bacteroidota bacterium]